MWVFVMIVYIFNPNGVHSHYEKRVDKQYFQTEQQCLDFQDIYVSSAQQFGTGGRQVDVGCIYDKNAGKNGTTRVR